MSTQVNDHLIGQYLKTTYSAHTPLGVLELHVGEPHPLLEELCDLHRMMNWAYLTAWNPGGLMCATMRNAEYMKRLGRRLITMRSRPRVFGGSGRFTEFGPWEEPSFLCLGVGVRTAHDLAVEFKQLAYVRGVGGGPAELVIIRDGKSVPYEIPK